MSRAVERLGAKPDRVARERSLDTRDGEDMRPDSDGHARPAPVTPGPPPPNRP